MEPIATAILSKPDLWSKLLEQMPGACIMLILVVLYGFYLNMLIKEHRKDMTNLIGQYYDTNSRSIDSIEKTGNVLAANQEIWRNQAELIKTCQRKNI